MAIYTPAWQQPTAEPSTPLSKYNPASSQYWLNNLSGTNSGQVLGDTNTATTPQTLTGSVGAPTVSTPAYNPVQDQLNNLNSTYDYNAEQARNQLSSLDNQYNQSVGEANNNFQNTANQIKNTKTQNLSEIDKQIQTAGSTAQQTQSKNRNVLRALGILNSSYAGESLNRPMEQFATQRNDLMNVAQQRAQELDDTLTQATQQHQSMLNNLRNNYTQLVNQVQSDLRFNDRQRADAIQAVNNALAQNIYNIQQQQQSITSQVANQKSMLEKALQSVNSKSMPQANMSNILAMSEIPGQLKPISQQTAIYNDNQKKLTDYGLA